MALPDQDSGESSGRRTPGYLAGFSVHISVDLVPATRRCLSFLARIAASPWLHQLPTLRKSVQRYHELWMPMIFDLSRPSSRRPPTLLPPLDVEWVWLCHSLNSPSYRRYCERRFSAVVDRPAIFDDENQEYAESRCRELWAQRYPSEPFDLEDNGGGYSAAGEDEDGGGDRRCILAAVLAWEECCLYKKFCQPYFSELVFLIATRQRYKAFLGLLLLQKRGGNGYSGAAVPLVPTIDILLMCLTHRSYPLAYAADVGELEAALEKVAGIEQVVDDEDIKATKRLWETTFDRPYERAGATIEPAFSDRGPVIIWDSSDIDVNRKFKALEPRFLLEVCIFLKGQYDKADMDVVKRTFIRLQMARCHRDLKLDKPIVAVASDSWHKFCHLYSEFGTRGVLVEVRQQGGGCTCDSKVKKIVPFLWNDLLRAPSLTVERPLEGTQMCAVVSITPPVQAPYLLKCVPDRVTDDAGAMISDVILRMNHYRPQEGRWLSRTVLDHAGRECFVVRIRMGEGIWRRRGETPSAVSWQERIIEVREGCWSYVAGSVGRAPEKVVGTAIPKRDQEDKTATWSLSTGYILTVDWEEGPGFHLDSENSDDDSEVRLLKGRKLQYKGGEQSSSEEQEKDEEDGFLTLARYTPEKPDGKATALLNWRLLVAEISPEEDVVTALLLCMVIVRSVCELRGEDVGRMLVRRREREAMLGRTDWGSVVLHPSSSRADSSIHLRPWFWNAKEVFELPKADYTRQQTYNYSPSDGGEGLYKRGILYKGR